MEFFNKENSSYYFSDKSNALKKEIERMSDKDILSCDFEEWIEYLYSKYFVVKIVIFQENTRQSLDEVKIKKARFLRSSSYGDDFIEIDGYRIRYTIYFDGESNLFDLQPSSRILMEFPYSSFTRPIGEDCGKFVLEYNFTKDELDSNKDVKKYLADNFDRDFKYYLTMLENLNNEADSYNNSLKNIISSALNKRIEKASSFRKLSMKLEIPMNLSSTAPNIKPIPLKRTNRTPSVKPQSKPQKKEYCISHDDYSNINNIIITCGSAMEILAKSYWHNNEEELRDYILTTLATHYDNTTGETFRKIGKTDIQIQFDSKAAFIGECKIWHGTKNFTEALQQLFNYSTWKDSKVSLIIFNKDNKSFTDILKNIKKWLGENTTSWNEEKENVWYCKYFRTDMKKEIEICIIAFDIYVDETQFRDNRFPK